VILPKRADSHLEKTTHAVQEFQKSPYRLPFAVRLDAMEKKLRLATETLKEIKVMGPNWCELRPSFEGPEVAEKMPVEHKIFLKMNRIYRRIIRIIRVNTCVRASSRNVTLFVSFIDHGSFPILSLWFCRCWTLHLTEPSMQALSSFRNWAELSEDFWMNGISHRIRTRMMTKHFTLIKQRHGNKTWLKKKE